MSQQARLPYFVRRDLSSEPMTADRDAYEVLQVHPRAEQQVIQAAYRVLAAMYHPDAPTSSANARRMAELNAAYGKIRTVELRQAYDRQLRAGGGGIDFRRRCTRRRRQALLGRLRRGGPWTSADTKG